MAISVYSGGEPMLAEAERWERHYAPEIAKLPPPSSSSQEEALLTLSSTWLSLDLTTLRPTPGKSALETLSDETFWQILQDLKINGLQVDSLKGIEGERIGFSILPQWGTEWPKIVQAAKKRGVALIGSLLGYTTGRGPDFQRALQNISTYPSLYHLVEIPSFDWKLLPPIPVDSSWTNVPWLMLDNLHQKGYVPNHIRAYVKESLWDATAIISCPDAQKRRWIYLQENFGAPVLSWLSPSFNAQRLMAADALCALYQDFQKIFWIDAKIPSHAQTTTSLWVRKLGGFTLQKTEGTLDELRGFSADAAADTLTRPALLHALLTEDAGALSLIYRLCLAEGIPMNRLIHALEPFDRFACSWTEFAANPLKPYLYREEKITGEVLKGRLFKEDLAHIQGTATIAPSTWARHCSSAFEDNQLRDKGHLLLAFAYAMQPGIFSLSYADLIGSTVESPPLSIDLLGFNEQALYPSLPLQIQSPHTFASQLKHILAVRESSQIARAALIEVPSSHHKGTLLLLHRLKSSRFIHLLALNFSRHSVQETLQFPGIQGTWGIDLMSGQSQEKIFEADSFLFDLPPLSGRAFLFQPKYYD